MLLCSCSSIIFIIVTKLCISLLLADIHLPRKSITLRSLSTCFREVLPVSSPCGCVCSSPRSNLRWLSQGQLLRSEGQRTSVVVSTLSHSGKAVAGKALATQEAGKCSTFLSKNEQLEVGAKSTGVSPFSNRDISPYTGSGSSDMIVGGAL